MELLYPICVNIKLYYGFENGSAVSQKATNKFTIRPWNFITGYISMRHGNYIHIKVYLLIFTEALFLIGKKYKEHKCPLTVEWKINCSICMNLISLS